MAKDPFKELPPIVPEDELDADPLAPPSAPPDEDITKGAAPRNVLKTLSNAAVPLVGGGVLLWWLVVPEPTQDRAAPAAVVEVSRTQQASDTSAMITALKEDAVRRATPVTPSMPGSVPAGGLPSGANPAQQQSSAVAPAVMPMPGPMYSGNGSPEAKAAEDAIRRAEEVRASPLEVGAIKLIDTGASGSSGSLTPSGMLAEVEARKAAAVADIDAQTNAMLARSLAGAGAGVQSQPAPAAAGGGGNAAFLAANAAASTANPQLLQQQAPAAQYVVNEGTVIRTVLLSDVSSDLPGSVIARVTSDVYDSTQRHVVIPKGSQLIGAYNSAVAIGQERLLMAMNRLILPNGTWVSLAGSNATDSMGMSGLKANVNNHFIKMFGSSLILGGASLLLPDDQTRVTVEGNDPTGRAQAGSTFAMSLNEVLRTLLERNKNISPTLSLKAGEEFMFMVSQDMAMIPYRGR